MQVPRVSACNPYRNKRAEETDQHYVARLKAELKQKFLDVGPERIAGFFCEPVVGAVSIQEHSLLSTMHLQVLACSRRCWTVTQSLQAKPGSGWLIVSLLHHAHHMPNH
jgi:hypothetical protein